MPAISLLIKPASSLCNLRCKYCFYHSLSENRMKSSYGLMDSETQEIIIKKALDYADDMCTFAFQGGEPTLVGLDYFRTFVDNVKKNNIKKLKINYAIQTNGLKIDENWARFLSENNFLTGISLDGPKDIHDSLRQDTDEKGSYNRVMEAINLFNKFHVEYNILFVVNSFVARHVNKVYNFFKKNGFKYLQFIPCLDPLGETPGGFEYSLTPERFTFFLNNLFDAWYNDFLKGNRISIRYFDNLVGMMLGYPPESCGMSGVCTSYFVVEADGKVYPCDFYVIDEWYLGDIHEADFAELQHCDTAEKFVGTSDYIDPSCRICEFFKLCRGGCRRSREPFKDGRPDLNYFCPSYKAFFKYAASRLNEIARRLCV